MVAVNPAGDTMPNDIDLARIRRFLPNKEVAPHEVFISFNNDNEGIAFREWFELHGRELFKEWFEHGRREGD